MGAWLLSAIGLALVLEGLMPFLHPKGWRSVFEKVLSLTDGQLRFMGLVSLLLGVLILFLAKR